MWKRIKSTAMKFDYETEQETDGRWIAEVLELSGVLAYGVTEVEAIANAESLALRVLVEREQDLSTHSPCGSGP
jgi:predicted RNase H-like HicB family nuclease